jgi:hypothetical protein
VCDMEPLFVCVFELVVLSEPVFVMIVVWVCRIDLLGLVDIDWVLVDAAVADLVGEPVDVFELLAEPVIVADCVLLLEAWGVCVGGGAAVFVTLFVFVLVWFGEDDGE